MFLTGSAGTGKTLVLSEALKIKLSWFKFRGTDVKMFVTTKEDTDWRSSASRQGPRGRGRRSGSWTTTQLLNICTLSNVSTI